MDLFECFLNLRNAAAKNNAQIYAFVFHPKTLHQIQLALSEIITVDITKDIYTPAGKIYGINLGAGNYIPENIIRVAYSEQEFNEIKEMGITQKDAMIMIKEATETMERNLKNVKDI